MSDNVSEVPPADNVDTIVLISVDSLRADRVHSEYKGVRLTPNIDDLVDESIEFDEGIAPAPGTPDSVPSLLTGGYPSQFPGFSLPEGKKEPLTIAERLSEKGFSTAAFNQNNLISRRYNYNRGFDNYFDISEETRRETGRSTWRLKVRNVIEDTPLMTAAQWAQAWNIKLRGKSLFVTSELGDSLTTRALEWLGNQDEKQFLWLHYMDAHYPYMSSEEIQRLFGDPIPQKEILRLSEKASSDPESLTEAEINQLEHHYNCSIRFVDKQIGRIITYLDERNEFDNSLFIVTADHGEEFLEHGGFGHRHALWEELIRVPLIIRYPPVGDLDVNGQAPVREISDTILGGDGLLDLLDGGAEYIVAETRKGPDGIRCCRGNGMKLILEDGERTFTQIDEWEENVIDEESVETGTIESFEAEIRKIDELKRTETVDVDESKLEDDLEALGYLDDD